MNADERAYRETLSMSLRDDIAAALFSAYAAPGPRVTISSAEIDGFLRMADECIRQMEWARDQVPTWLSPIGLGKLPMTAAPKDEARYYWDQGVRQNYPQAVESLVKERNKATGERDSALEVIRASRSVSLWRRGGYGDKEPKGFWLALERLHQATEALDEEAWTQ